MRFSKVVSIVIYHAAAARNTIATGKYDQRVYQRRTYMCVYIYIHTHTFEGVLKSGTPKSSILMGFYLINHPFGDTPTLGNHHIYIYIYIYVCIYIYIYT